MRGIVLAAGLLAAPLAGAHLSSAQTPEAPAQDRATTGQGAAGAQGAAIAPDQRRRIVEIIKQRGVREATEVKFRLSIGADVPISETLFPLPAGVVAIRPEWRDYHFLVIGNKVVVVDPLQLKVRAIIEH